MVGHSRSRILVQAPSEDQRIVVVRYSPYVALEPEVDFWAPREDAVRQHLIDGWRERQQSTEVGRSWPFERIIDPILQDKIPSGELQEWDEGRGWPCSVEEHT